MKTVKFTANGYCHEIGAFSSGAIATLDDAVAKHLVEQAFAAKYIEVQKKEPKKANTKK